MEGRPTEDCHPSIPHRYPDCWDKCPVPAEEGNLLSASDRLHPANTKTSGFFSAPLYVGYHIKTVHRHFQHTYQTGSIPLYQSHRPAGGTVKNPVPHPPRNVPDDPIKVSWQICPPDLKQQGNRLPENN